VGCIFPIIGDRESCKIELTTAVPEGSNASAFTLDLDYSMTKPESIQFDQSLSGSKKHTKDLKGSSKDVSHNL